MTEGAGAGTVLVVEPRVFKDAGSGLVIVGIGDDDGGDADWVHLPSLVEGYLTIEVQAGHGDVEVGAAGTCNVEHVGIDVDAVDASAGRSD
jgi:hypothetical protein